MQTLYPIFGSRIVAPVEERRAAEPFPPLHLLTGANGDFATELNKWFDDRVGFRDLLIRSKNQVDYSLFNTSKKVFIGANGWLFDRHQFDGIANVDASGLTALEASYLALARRLNDKGIHLIVVGYPQKVALYPEDRRRPTCRYGPVAVIMATVPKFSFQPIRAHLHRRRSDNEGS